MLALATEPTKARGEESRLDYPASTILLFVMCIMIMSQYFSHDQDPAVHRRNKRGLDVTKHGKQGKRRIITPILQMGNEGLERLRDRSCRAVDSSGLDTANGLSIC